MGMHPNEKVGIVYHANCIDGFTAAWATHKFLVENYGLVHIELLPATYQKSFAAARKLAMSCSKLYIVDFSFPEDQLKELGTFVGRQVIVLDHHESTFKALIGATAKLKRYTFQLTPKVAVILDNSMSGAAMVWKYFTGCQYHEMPRMIQLVSDYDTWQFKHAYTKQFNKILKIADQDLLTWCNLYEQSEDAEGFTLLITGARGIMKYHEMLVDQIAEAAQPLIIETAKKSYLGAIVPCPYALISDVGAEICLKHNFAAMISYEGTEAVVSLRSNNESNVTAIDIAEAFGGGGHKDAAGFRIRTVALRLGSDQIWHI